MRLSLQEGERDYHMTGSPARKPCLAVFRGQGRSRLGSTAYGSVLRI